MRRATENPMEAIADMLAFNSRDWSKDTADAYALHSSWELIAYLMDPSS